MLSVSDMRGMVPTGELLEMGNLREFWAKIDEFGLIEALPPLGKSQALSARAFDEAQPAGLRTYMQATQFLGVAHDNHSALMTLLASQGATVWAPWSLLRQTFEAGSYATWILDPDGTGGHSPPYRRWRRPPLPTNVGSIRVQSPPTRVRRPS
jgi:hypothetical protein